VKITNGKGLRIAFDPVGGSGIPKILEASSYLGIFFQYGALDASDVQAPVPALLSKNLTIRRNQRLEGAKCFIVAGLASVAVKPVIAKAFKLDEIVDAYRFMESNAQIGKSWSPSEHARVFF
jgi:NADPH:quinone reductase-like Zn-dependent oxidoreductase